MGGNLDYNLVMVRLCLWSGPRNVSTALLYAFNQRTDTLALDEPLYGHYLRVSGASHPAAAEVMAAMECDGTRVVRDVVLGPGDRAVSFQKHMAHHLVDLDRGFLRQTTNVLLIRDPAEVVVTLAKQISEPSIRDVGIAMQCDLLGQLSAMGQDPPVLDAKELLLDPEGVLKQLCQRTGIPWDSAMLSWPAGPKPCDGMWAPHWYENVHRSRGFEPWRPRDATVAPQLARLIDECRPHYEQLRAMAIPARSGVMR